MNKNVTNNHSLINQYHRMQLYSFFISTLPLENVALTMAFSFNYVYKSLEEITKKK
jgi:hypothetical protein